MATSVEEVERAFLSWLNSLGISEEPLASALSLKDGVLLTKLLHSIDSEFFSMDECNPLASPSWTVCASNLQKLNKNVDKYLETVLNLSFHKEIIDIPSIARDDNKLHMVRLCEKILAIAGNCKTNKDSFIDVILGLEEHIQATLMEIMLKFIAKEEPSPHFSSPTVEGELVESLNAQLKQKEVERISMLEHVKKVEQENAEMAKKMAEIQNAYKEVTAEKLQEKSEFEEYKNRHYSGDSTPKIMQREAELEEEIDNLYNELSATKKAIGNMEKEKNEEIERLKDELTYAKTNAKKSAAMESLVGQLKKKIDELTLDKQSMAEELKNMESLQLRINSLEKDKKHVEDKNKKLIEDLYTEKNESRRVELEFKKLKAEYAKIEKELKYLEEKCKFSENQAKISEEALANFKKESESTRNSGDAGSLFALEKEASYKEEIEKLRADLQQLQADVGEAPKTRIVELEAMLKNLTEEKAKLEENLAAVNKRADEAERQSEDLKAQVDVLKKGNEATAEYVKEYQRVKKDRDTLLDVAKRAQDTLTELDALKNTTAELRNENETLKQSMESLKNEKATFEAELKKVKEMNGRFEKKLARDEEKIIFLQEERKRLETALQGTQKEVETELAKRLEEELAKQRQLLKQKYKAKTKSITEILEEKETSLIQKEEENKQLKVRLQEIETQIKSEYQEEIKVIKEKVETEKEVVKKGWKESAETAKREEKLLSSAIYEMGLIINKIMLDKKKGGTVLAQLAEEHQKGYADSFITAQINARAQSNTKKS